MAKGLVLGAQDGEILAESLDRLLESPEQVSRYLMFVTGVPSIEEMNEAELIALQRLLKPVHEDDQWVPCSDAITEAAAAIAALDEQEIQQDSESESE
jgi:hypothetical protein